MAVVNVELSVTKIEYILDLSAFAGHGNSTVNITIPTATGYRQHYQDRELPPIIIISSGNLAVDDSIYLTVTSGGETVLEKNIIPDFSINIELRTLKLLGASWRVLDTGLIAPEVPPIEKQELYVRVDETATSSVVTGTNFLNDNGSLAHISFSTTGAGNFKVLIEGRTMTADELEKLFVEIEPLGTNTAVATTESTESGIEIVVETKNQGGGNVSLGFKLHTIYLK